MHLRALSLVDFRNYAGCELELPAGPVAFVGANGQGKTNLVEAVGYLATLSSHRVAADAPLVRTGCASAVVRGQLARDDRAVLLEVEILPGKANRARLNRSPVRRARDILGYARVVTFAPEDLALVRGDPDGRRKFLDELLVLRAPRMAALRADYDKALRQRNALLRDLARHGGARGSDTALDDWDGLLAATGGMLAAARWSLVGAVGPRLTSAYEGLSGSGAAAVRYRSAVLPEHVAGEVTGVADPGWWEQEILQALRASRAAEIARGVSLAGPHRDDLAVTLGGQPAKGFASHGEGWSLALGLRLAAYDLLRSDLGDTPILVLDDVFAELDATRRARLADLVADAEQVLVTAAVPEDVPEGLRETRIDVRAGAASVVGRSGAAVPAGGQP